MMSVWHRAFRLLVFTHLLSWDCFFFLINSCSELPMYRAIGHYSYISLKEMGVVAPNSSCSPAEYCLDASNSLSLFLGRRE